MVRFNDEVNVTAEKKEKMYAHIDKNIRATITNKSRGKNY